MTKRDIHLCSSTLPVVLRNQLSNVKQANTGKNRRNRLAYQRWKQGCWAGPWPLSFVEQHDLESNGKCIKRNREGAERVETPR